MKTGNAPKRWRRHFKRKIGPCGGTVITGKVVKITDGDTLYVLDANYEQHKIRLAARG